MARRHAQQLASLLLGRPVNDWVIEQRGDTLPKTPWRLVARRLNEATNGQIDVTAEAIRLWVADEQAKAAS